MADLIIDTAARVGITPREVFVQAAESKGFTNAPEVAAHRYQRWFKHGEVTQFVEDWCLTQWRSHDRNDQAVGSTSVGSA